MDGVIVDNGIVDVKGEEGTKNNKALDAIVWLMCFP